MMTKSQTTPEPDHIARKLFIATMLGACTFALVVTAMTHLVPKDLGSDHVPLKAIVHLVPAP